MTLLRGGQEHPISITPIQPYRAAVGRFLAAVRGETSPLASVRDERHNLTALLAFADSLRQGQPVAVDTAYRGPSIFT